MTIFGSLLSAVTGQSQVTSRSTGASQIISGANQQPSASNAVAKVSATLDAANADAGKQQIMAAVQLRIQGIVEGLIEPQETWEKVAGFLAITGQPFTYNVNNFGEVDVTPQTLDDLSFVPPGQQNAMRQALERLDEVRLAVDSRNTKVAFRATLQSAVGRITEMQQFSPPDAQWERDFNVIKSTGRPVVVGLSPTGDLRAIDQLDSNFDYVEDPEKRSLLQAAGRDWQNILNGVGSATESWQFEALGNKVDQKDYYLDITDQNEIVVRRNTDRRETTTDLLFRQSASDFYIIPEFLRQTDSENQIFQASWEEDAAAFIQAKKPFNIERIGERIVVRETNFTSARRQDLLDFRQGQQDVGNAIVSVIT